MAGSAIGPGAAVAGVGGKKLLRQAAAQFGHRRADRQLRRLQARPASGQRPCRQGGQALYLGGGLRRQRPAEPPLSPAGAAGGSRPCAGGPAGLASQIASLTSTICSLTARNSL